MFNIVMIISVITVAILKQGPVVPYFLVLTDEEVIGRLIKKKQSITHVNNPEEQDANDSNFTNCLRCTSKIDDQLHHLFKSSPYSKLLRQRQFIPLDDNSFEVMSKDIDSNPQVFFFSAVALFGAILLNSNNHREPHGKIKKDVLTTSLPPPIKTIHPNLWPCVLKRQDGKKLVVGTRVSNILVTSSIRLYQKIPTSVGGSHTGFEMETVRASPTDYLIL